MAFAWFFLILKSEKKDELGNRDYLNEVQRFASVVSSK